MSFTWNGIGLFKGIPTVYDTGTGTLEEYRGIGLASRIFEHSVPYLKAAGIQQYILEVLEENQKAISVYSKQGFKTTRTFDCFRVNVNEWKIPEIKSPAVIQLREIDLSYQSEMESMLDFELSWQNNFEALRKNPLDFTILGAFYHNTLVAFGIIEPSSGDIPILAVRENERKKGIGSWIFQELIMYNQSDIIKVVNIESNQAAIVKFLLKNNIPKLVTQFEMKRML